MFARKNAAGAATFEGRFREVDTGEIGLGAAADAITPSGCVGAAQVVLFGGFQQLLLSFEGAGVGDEGEGPGFGIGNYAGRGRLQM